MPDDYRARAAECLKLANENNDPHRAFLMEMAHAWLRLHDQAEKNSQADISYQTAPRPRPPGPGKQIQSKLRRDLDAR
jgi:hypothetical protein